MQKKWAKKMIPDIQKTYYQNNFPKKDRWAESQRLKIEIMNKAKTHEEYEEMIKKLVNKLKI